MQFTNQTRTALNEMFAAVLKAHFTRAEIEMLSQTGVSLQGTLSSGFYDEASIADGQKQSLSLQSRFQTDDVNDYLLCAAAASAGLMLRRSDFGVAGQDGFLESLGSVFIKGLEEIKDAASYVGMAKDDKRLINVTTGRLEEDPNDSLTELLEPTITFANPATINVFLTKFIYKKLV